MNGALKTFVTARGSRQGFWLLSLALFCVLVITLSINSGQFFSLENLLNLASQSLPLLITAIGQFLVVIIGGLDLSVGSVVSFTTAILALGGSAWLLVPLALLLVALIGCVNGVVITRFNVHPIVATLSMQYIVRGITLILRPVSGGSVPDAIIQSVSGSLFGVPFSIFWMIGVVLLSVKIIYGSRFGLHLFAIGGGNANSIDQAARNFGVPVARNTIAAYVLCSLFAGLAGIFLAGRIVSGDPNVGLLFELDTVTAVAIGGTQLAGGIGSLHGTILGALVMALLANGMNLLNVSAFVQTTIKGAILLVVIALQTRKKMGL